MKNYVLYLRVSSKEQGKSGLGLEAQKRDVNLFLENYADDGSEVIGEFIEVQSGKDDERPELHEAIHLAKRTKSILLVAKLDRLSRKVSFTASLMEDKSLSFKVAQMPFADNFQLHIYAALASQEADFISSRTKASLKSWKERNPNKKLGAPVHHIKKLAKARTEKALQEAQKVSGVILPLRQQGASLRGICEVLNSTGITTIRGTSFHPSLVSRMLSSLEVA